MSPLITGLLVVSGIAAVFALLLEVADSYIADYGTPTITVNDEKVLEVKGGRPLLFALAESGMFVPSACGGKGTCGYCKVKILEGGGPVLPTEKISLSPEEIGDQVRISCQVKVKRDLRIEMPAEYFNIREYRTVVEKIEPLTDEIRSVTLKILDPDEGITFIPGQYLQFEVPPYELSSQREYRAYSIASDAADHHRVELVITKVKGGLVSTYVHDYLKEGEEITARGPFGEFSLIESERDILLIAGGSGLAPIRSVLFQIEREGITRKTTLFFGAKTPADLYYLDEMKRFEETLADFTFVPILSRVGPEDRWEGRTGRVTALIDTDVADNAPVDVHLCGAPPMIRSCVDLLTAKGIPAGHIAYDKFE